MARNQAFIVINSNTQRPIIAGDKIAQEALEHDDENGKVDYHHPTAGSLAKLRLKGPLPNAAAKEAVDHPD